MRITAVDTHWLSLKEVKLRADSTQQSLIVRIRTDEGIEGIGESHTAPYVIKAIIDTDSTGVVSRGIRSLLIGENPLDIERLWNKMYHFTTRYGRRGILIHTISAVDIALWDLLGKATGLSVSTLLGGREREELTAYASVLMPDTPEAAAELALKLKEDGYIAAKFGWETLGYDIPSDIKRVEAIRRAVGDSFDVLIDIGYSMTVRNAIKLARALEDYQIGFFEEPLSPDDLVGFAKLSEATIIPIATGERETSRYGFLDLMQRGKVSIIQPDIGRTGGFTEVKRIAVLADMNAVDLIPHVWSNDILVASSLHLLAARPNAAYLEYSVLDTVNPIRQELLREPIKAVKGKVAVPKGPGLGIELNESIIKRFSITSL